MRLPYLFLPAVAILAALALVPTAGAAQQVVLVEAVTLVPTQRTERVIGSLRAASTATIAALEEGALIEVLVKEGAVVPKGTVLARTDTRRLVALRREVQAELARDRAALVQFEAELSNARDDLVAIEAAAKDNAVSDRVLREARTSVAVREARVAAARESLGAVEGRLELLDVRITDADVRAPFDGEVVARHAEPGEWIHPGDPIVTLNSTGTIEAWLEVPERFLKDLDPSAAVIVHATATGGTFQSSATRILPQVHERARTFPLIVEIPNTGGALKPGMSIDAEIPVGPKVAQLLVPKDAVLRRGGATYLFRVHTEGEARSAEQVPLEVLFELADHVAVAPGGLEPGDPVVVEGNERLAPGAPVLVHGTRDRRVAGPGASPPPADGSSEGTN